MTFPLYYQNSTNFINSSMNYSNPLWCTNDEGEIYTTYRFKCREFYTNIKKSKTNLFDYNFDLSKNKSIFITDIYEQSGGKGGLIFTMCISFIDPLSDNDAYICSDISKSKIIMTLENLNKKLNGYFFVNSVGFNHVFY